MASPKMPQSARLERLEKKVGRLERRIARVVRDPDEERFRARLLVLQHLRKHKQIDGVKFSVKHGLNFGDVEGALDDLEKMRSVDRLDD